MGEEIIRQAQIILFHARQLKENIQTRKGTVTGNLSLAMIPTVAPYLLPGFMSVFRTRHPEISIKMAEMRTETIIAKLHHAEIDMAVLSTPLDDPRILEVPLYYEKFVAYISPGEPLYEKQEISISELPLEHLWVLEEGHCMRNQVFNLCENKTHTAIFEAGSIDTLVKIVDLNGGCTIIPELHVDLLNETRRGNLRKIVLPEATREISLVIRNDYVRERMMNVVADSIREIIPPAMVDARLKKFAIRL
jgi:LysR family hydrogen peroxide-inducible transcriptional activator